MAERGSDMSAEGRVLRPSRSAKTLAFSVSSYRVKLERARAEAEGMRREALAERVVALKEVRDGRHLTLEHVMVS